MYGCSLQKCLHCSVCSNVFIKRKGSQKTSRQYAAASQAQEPPPTHTPPPPAPPPRLWRRRCAARPVSVGSQHTLHHLVPRTQIAQWSRHHRPGLTVTAAEASLTLPHLQPSPLPLISSPRSPATLRLTRFHNPLGLRASGAASNGARSYKENTASSCAGYTGDSLPSDTRCTPSHCDRPRPARQSARSLPPPEALSPSPSQAPPPSASPRSRTAQPATEAQPIPSRRPRARPTRLPAPRPFPSSRFHMGGVLVSGRLVQ